MKEKSLYNRNVNISGWWRFFSKRYKGSLNGLTCYQKPLEKSNNLPIYYLFILSFMLNFSNGVLVLTRNPEGTRRSIFSKAGRLKIISTQSLTFSWWNQSKKVSNFCLGAVKKKQNAFLLELITTTRKGKKLRRRWFIIFYFFIFL